MRNTQKNSNNVITIVLTGLLIAIALVIKYFSAYIFIAGVPALRVGFAGPFSNMPGILFGPMIGGITKGLVDLLGYLIKPNGAYIPLLTITSIIGGVLVPFLWNSLKNINPKKLQKTFLIIFLCIGVLGLINQLVLVFLPDSGLSKSIFALGKNQRVATIGLEITALIGLLLFLVNIYVKKKFNNSYIHEYFLKLIIALGISGIIVTTLNTEILRLFIPGLSNKAFLLLWVPRLIEEIFMTIFNAYVLSLLLQIYYRINR